MKLTRRSLRLIPNGLLKTSLLLVCTERILGIELRWYSSRRMVLHCGGCGTCSRSGVGSVRRLTILCDQSVSLRVKQQHYSSKRGEVRGSRDVGGSVSHFLYFFPLYLGDYLTCCRRVQRQIGHLVYVPTRSNACRRRCWSPGRRADVLSRS